MSAEDSNSEAVQLPVSNVSEFWMDMEKQLEACNISPKDMHAAVCSPLKSGATDGSPKRGQSSRASGKSGGGSVRKVSSKIVGTKSPKTSPPPEKEEEENQNRFGMRELQRVYRKASRSRLRSRSKGSLRGSVPTPLADYIVPTSPKSFSATSPKPSNKSLKPSKSPAKPKSKSKSPKSPAKPKSRSKSKSPKPKLELPIPSRQTRSRTRSQTRAQRQQNLVQKSSPTSSSPKLKAKSPKAKSPTPKKKNIRSPKVKSPKQLSPRKNKNAAGGDLIRKQPFGYTTYHEPDLDDPLSYKVMDKDGKNVKIFTLDGKEVKIPSNKMSHQRYKNLKKKFRNERKDKNKRISQYETHAFINTANNFDYDHEAHHATCEE